MKKSFKKHYKKTSLFFFLFVFSLSLFAQENYFTNKDGEKVILYSNKKQETTFYKEYILEGDISFTAQYFFYYNKSGKRKKIKQGKVKEVHFENTQYISLPIGAAGKRLHEVIASNDKYLLTNYFSRANYFYVFDKNNKPVKKKMKHSWKRKDDYRSLKTLKKYFSNCPELLATIKSNIENSDYKMMHGDVAVVKNNMFASLKNYQCK
ncbi:MAG: hypothetical protein AB8F74_07380 [Saprospiraceae bacterium]